MNMRDEIIKCLDFFDASLVEFRESGSDNDDIVDICSEIEGVCISCWAIGFTCSKCPDAPFPLGDPLSAKKFGKFTKLLFAFKDIVLDAKQSEQPSNTQVEECFRLRRRIRATTREIVQEFRN